MSLFSRLFGSGGRDGGADAAANIAETYRGFTITPAPRKDGSGYRISARIEKAIGGETKTHTLIRADTVNDVETAMTASLGKAKMLIDEQGEAIFDGP